MATAAARRLTRPQGRAARTRTADDYARQVGPIALAAWQAANSYGQAAAVLTERGIRTPRGGKWTRAAVRALIQRHMGGSPALTPEQQTETSHHAEGAIGILTQVRSRLLDFILELKDTLGNIDGDEAMKTKVKEVDTSALFRQTVFGDNATIILGSHNKLAIQSQVHEGDFVSLANALTNAGIPDDEVAALRAAIEEDKASGGITLSDGQTGGWFLKLLGRAAKGALKVGTDVVSHVVTDALTAYIGGS